MLELRTTDIKAPTTVGCSGCGDRIETNTTVHVTEVEVAKESMTRDVVIENEFALWCSICFHAMKMAAQRLHVPIVFELDLRETRAANTHEFKEKKF